VNTGRLRLFLIDGNSFCYRAYYAIKSLSNSKGFPTNAVYGFISMLKKLIDSEKPDLIAVTFDLKGPTFRHKKYSDYKANRKPMPDDMAVQIPVIKEVVSAYNIPIYEKQGFEADDIIGTISKRAEEKGIITFIVTGDKDALQLVSKHTKVYSTHKEGLIYDEDKVRQRYGVRPQGIVDILALMGDTSDNIPGIPGIGEKTAIQLMASFEGLDDLIKNIDSIKSNAKKDMIRTNIEKAYMSRELALIDRDVDMEVDFDAMLVKEPDNDRLLGLFKELEFRRLANDIMPKKKLEGSYSVARTKEGFDRLVSCLKSHKEWAFDFETTSTDPMSCEIAGVSFCWAPGKAEYISFVKNHKVFSDKEYILKKLKPVFEDEGIKKIGQNIKYEILVLRNSGIDLKGVCFDTMIASYLINPSKLNHNLSDISEEYLGFGMTAISSLIGKGKGKITMADVGLEEISEYCCQDSDAAFRLKGILYQKLKQKGLEALFEKIELPLVYVLSDMEFSGISIDADFLKNMSKAMRIRLDELTKHIHAAAGCEFNVNSPKQLGNILFDKLGLPVVKKTKTGASTDVDVLKTLSASYDIAKLLLEYRELSKLTSTYVDSLPGLINKKTHKVHASFNQTVTVTGRLSSSNPNLQNIPVKTDIGRKIRGAFIPSFKNGFVLSADYSQIELRILAHLSKDPMLSEAFNSGLDIHTHTASLIFGCDESKVDDTMRTQAKTVNFGIIYGMSPYGLSKELGIGPETAKGFIEAYFLRYSSVSEYMQSQISFAQENGYVLTMFNRRRYIPEINSENQNVRQFAQRTAINTPIQGSAADMIKIAMADIYRQLKSNDFNAKMVMQVHDELVFDLPEKELRQVTAIIKQSMESVVELNVPVKVNIASGRNWQEA